jgi:hypothetical protein
MHLGLFFVVVVKNNCMCSMYRRLNYNMSLPDLSHLSDSDRKTYNELSLKYGVNARQDPLNPNPEFNKLTDAERREYTNLKTRMHNVGFDTKFTDQDDTRFKELTAKLNSKGGRSKSSKKRPTARRRRSSKARKSRKSRKSRATRRR